MTNPLAQRLSTIRPSGTKAMTAKAQALKREGRDVIALSQGEPDFDTPDAVREAAIRAIRDGHTHYTAVAGITPLREAVVAKFARDNGLVYDEDQVTVGCGAKQVLYNALLATLDPGDEVVFPTPCWVSYPDMVRLAGGVPVPVECPESSGFKLSAEALEAAITPRTKWLMLNSPSNPTGAVYSRAELQALAEVLRRHPRVWVLSDDIYEKIVYGDVAFATMAEAAPDLKDRTLTVNGVSKAYAMTGWRVGYGAGPLALIKAMNIIQGQTTSHTSSIAQYAAVEALNGGQAAVEGFVREFRKRRDLVVARIGDMTGLHCGTPDGAFYVFCNCAALIGARTASGETIASDHDLAMHLLQAADVAVVPGAGFLASPYIRLSYATSEARLDQACERIARACAALELPQARKEALA